MTAKEARALSNTIVRKENLAQYDEIQKSVGAAVKKGSFECNYYSRISEAVVSQLSEEGFAINGPIPERDGEVTYKISW